ncbi:hypothetical protein SAMN04489835_0211 [Mycolicibacterium rutilum]|uniref:DUF2293 domain-containing protein n=1 Tax=Mycolicibacterium rutilum TaxID=370526 RepID=A0A1H6ILC1_MYCRU|nr:DUF2293 domain-containing protein [Mycolicibacterium rutilum]SEH47341.1 hypothetical protein SAMN04489835_0211 [Mycolicibacterium rutilum]
MGVRHAKEASHALECAKCRSAGDVLLESRGSEALCLDCLELGHLQFLPAGSAPLTRRVVKASAEPIGVMRWNPRWSRFERQGILAEPAVIEAAARASLVDADVRGRDEVTAQIREQFPGCPVERAEAIALHTAVRFRGRGRWRRGLREVGPEEVRQAVEESVLHVDTDYDELVRSGVDRAAALAQVSGRLGNVLSAWRGGVTMLDP